jgi:flagellar hook-basal body complex protein FliE
MALSGLSGIENILQQMRAVVLAAQGNGASEADLAPRTSGFAAELERSLKRVSAAQSETTAQAKAFELGEPGVSLSDVMINMQKDSLAFNTLVQVRNKLVAAYKEISTMAV